MRTAFVNGLSISSSTLARAQPATAPASICAQNKACKTTVKGSLSRRFVSSTRHSSFFGTVVSEQSVKNGSGPAHVMPIVSAVNDLWAQLKKAMTVEVEDNPTPVGPVINVSDVENGVPKVKIPGPLEEDPKSEKTLLAQFGAGCFWSVELGFQRVPGVIRTAVGYSQGTNKNPSYKDVCTGGSNHNEIVLVEYDPALTTYGKLLEAFWKKHDPTTPNQSGNDMGTQYRSGIYYYTEEQKAEAEASKAEYQKGLRRPIVTEILPAADFYYAEEYHQKYLSDKGGRIGSAQSPAKNCNDPIRCYG